MPPFELVRDFIQDSLYNPQYGYFNIQEPIIFTRDDDPHMMKMMTDNQEERLKQLLLPLIDFKSLDDQHDYIQSLKALYASKNQVWGTPVEVFQPCLAQSILNYMLDRFHHNSNQQEDDNRPFVVYEVGGGTGTCAMNILATLKLHHPSIYERTQYHIVEISSELHKIQKSRLLDEFSDHVQCHHMSVFDMENRREELLNQQEKHHAFVIALEVMDNLPHDKIVQKPDGSFTQIGVVHVGDNESGQAIYQEIEMPVVDAVIQRYLQYTRDDLIVTSSGDSDASSSSVDVLDPALMLDCRPKSKLKAISNKSTGFMRKMIVSLVGQGDEVFYIPTMQMQMVEILCSLFPSHHMVLADFDHLPNQDLNMYSESSIHNQPIVQRKFEKSIKMVNDPAFNKEYLSASFSTYLVPKGSCDIFFETQFEDLQRVYAHCRQSHGTSKGSTVMKMAQFVNRFLPAEDIDKMTTASGYNPMLLDYANFSFLVSDVMDMKMHK